MKARTLKILTILLLTALFLCGEIGPKNIVYANGPMIIDESQIVSGLTKISYDDLSQEAKEYISSRMYTTSELEYYIASETPATYTEDGSRTIYLYNIYAKSIIDNYCEAIPQLYKTFTNAELDAEINGASFYSDDVDTIKAAGAENFKFYLQDTIENKYTKEGVEIMCSKYVYYYVEHKTNKDVNYAVAISYETGEHNIINYLDTQIQESVEEIEGVKYHVVKGYCDCCYYYEAKNIHATTTTEENRVEATYTSKGSYEEVITCNVCDKEVSRKTIEIPMLTSGGGSDYDEPITEPAKQEVKAELKQKETLQKEVNNVIKELPEESGAQVKEATTSTLNALQKKLDNGKLTEKEYKECLNKIETIVETVAEVEKQKEEVGLSVEETQNSLPKEVALNLTDVVDEFYQKQIDLLLGTKDGELDLSLSEETYEKAVEFIEDSVNKIQDAALMIKNCSGVAVIESINDYINTLTSKSFKDFDKEAADAEFVEAAYNAILLNLQSQVSESLTAAYNSAKASGQYNGNALQELEDNYNEEMANVADMDSFEIMVSEVMRLKYISKLGEKLNNKEISNADYLNLVNDNAGDVDTFMPIYKEIFKSWALNEENEYGMTLEELTKAALDTTKEDMIPAEYDGKITDQDKAIIFTFVGSVGLGSIGFALFNVLKKRRLGINL